MNNRILKNVFCTVLLTFVVHCNGDQEFPLAEQVCADGGFLINEVAVIVDGPERRFYITKLELETPSFDGRIPSVDDIINEELVYQDALKHKIPITEYAQKHIQSIKKQNKLSDEKFEQICADVGLDPKAALEKFEKMGASNTMIEHKIMSRIYVPEHEVKAFYEENPIFKPAKYQLQVGFIPFDTTKSVEQQKQDVEKLSQTHPEQIRWNEPFRLKEDDIADDKKYITDLEPNQISPPQITDGGFELIRLTAKKPGHLVPLEKRYREILHNLRMPKLQHMIEEYKKELRSNSSIVDIRKPQEISRACDVVGN